MYKNYYKGIIPLTLVLTLLTSCGEKSKCDLPTSHVHKYTKQVTDNITIETYRDDETLNLFGGYNWNDEYIEINKVDEAVYRLMNSRELFDGVTNWSYLFNVMAAQKDYFSFFYEYDTEEIYYEKDANGNNVPRTKKVHHEGWTSNPYDSNNTGKTRLHHHRFFGYRVICENGKFKLEKSPIVDDIREVIDEYPYFSENPVTEVYETFYFSRFELGDLSVDDFDVFVGPDLSNPNLETGFSRIK